MKTEKSGSAKVSVIVPVYNVSDYLKKCMDSILNQTYTDLEVICINDGSSDNCQEILDSYRQIDDRVLVYQQQNSGVAVARNKAISIASGQFMIFVDPDDWIELDMVETCLSYILKHNSDVIMFSYFREYDKKTLKKNIFEEDIIFFDNVECEKLHRRHAGIVGSELRRPENADALCSLCTKMFKTDIIKSNDINYIDNKIIGTYGDGIFNLYYFKFVQKAIFINKHLYHYRKTNTKSITSVYDSRKFHLWKNQFKIIEDYIRINQFSQEYFDGLKNRVGLSYIVLGLNALKQKGGWTKILNTLDELLTDEEYSKGLNHISVRYMPIHWKVFFISCKRRWTVLLYLQLLLIAELKKHI